MEEIKNRIGEFILSGQVLREEDEGIMDGGDTGPNEGTPQSGESLQTLESASRKVEDTEKVEGGYENIGKDGRHSKKPLSKKDADDQRKAMFANGYKEGKGALKPSEDPRARYAHPTKPYEGPPTVEPDLQGDCTPETEPAEGGSFGKKTEKSLWDRDDDANWDDNNGDDTDHSDPKDKEDKDAEFKEDHSRYAGLDTPALEKLLQKVGQVRDQWSGNKADPFYAIYLKALKDQKEIQAIIRSREPARSHAGSSNPVHARSQINSPWGEGLDAKVLVKKMIERGLTNEQIKEVMKTQFAPIEGKKEEKAKSKQVDVPEAKAVKSKSSTSRK